MITPSNYRWTTDEPPNILEQWHLQQYMLHDRAAHIKNKLYNTFKTWAPEQHTKFFNANSCIPEFIIKRIMISMIIAQGTSKKKVTLPIAFREYADIFFKKTLMKLPSS